jgi:hypothetical protein
MRAPSGIVLGGFIVLSGVSGAFGVDEPPSACNAAVGTFLTTNVNPDSGKVVGRSLVSLTNGGHVFVTGSNQGGSGQFAPFTDAHGAWRCVSDENGRFHIRATVVDFTHPTAKFTNQKIARLDYDGTYDEASDRLSADVRLYFMPIDANPMDKTSLKDAIRNRVTGIRVTAP